MRECMMRIVDGFFGLSILTRFRRLEKNPVTVVVSFTPPQILAAKRHPPFEVGSSHET